MNGNMKKLAILAVVIATMAGLSATASARLNSQVSQGKGIKCFFVPVTQPNGAVIHEQVCRKVGV